MLELDKVKKAFFTLFSQPEASNIEFIRLKIVEDGVGNMQTTTIITTENMILKESVFNHLPEFVMALTQDEKISPDVVSIIRHLGDMSGLFAQMFFVYEQVGMNPELIESSMTAFSNVLKSAILVKMNETLYV